MAAKDSYWRTELQGLRKCPAQPVGYFLLNRLKQTPDTRFSASGVYVDVMAVVTTGGRGIKSHWRTHVRARGGRGLFTASLWTSRQRGVRGGRLNVKAVNYSDDIWSERLATANGKGYGRTLSPAQPQGSWKRFVFTINDLNLQFGDHFAFGRRASN